MARKPKTNVEVGIDATKGFAYMLLGLFLGCSVVGSLAYSTYYAITRWFM